MVVLPGPFFPCSSIAASTIRRRVSACFSARRLCSYFRATRKLLHTDVSSFAMNSRHTAAQRERREREREREESDMETRIDHIVGGVYRIATMTEAYGITFNQYLIDDERPTLVHTGNYDQYETICKA